MCVWSEGGQLSFPVSWPGIKPMPPVLGARSLNHWTIREAPIRFSLDSILKSTFLHKPVTWDYLIQPSFLAECKSLGVINRKNTSLIEYLWLTLGKERQSISIWRIPFSKLWGSGQKLLPDLKHSLFPIIFT